MRKTETVIIRIAFAVLGICFAIFAALALIQDSGYLFYGETIGIDDILTDNQDLEDYLGDYVSVDVRAAVDLYATTESTINNIPIKNANHYIIILDDNSFLSVTLPVRNSAEMDRICEESWMNSSGASDHPMHIEGTLEKMTREMEGYFADRLEQYGVNPSSDKIRHLTINTKDTRFSELLTPFVLFSFSAVMLTCAFSKKIMNKIEEWDRNHQSRGNRLGDRL